MKREDVIFIPRSDIRLRLVLILILMLGISLSRSNSYLSSILSENGIARSSVALFAGPLFDVEYDTRRCRQGTGWIWKGLVFLAVFFRRYLHQDIYGRIDSQHIGRLSLGKSKVCFVVLVIAYGRMIVM
jgi:hypothetical protein